MNFDMGQNSITNKFVVQIKIDNGKLMIHTIPLQNHTSTFLWVCRASDMLVC